MRPRKTARRLADDIRASFREVLAHASGKRTKARVHRVKRKVVRRAKTRLAS